ncbi:MAG: DUF6687 family protein [Bacteroidota bacterium]
MKQFLPFKQIKEQDQVVVVDAMHHHGLILSHWRGAPQIPGIHDDTSLGIVLNAIKAKHPSVHYPRITNNHFDIDGFLGVWSLFEPELALRYEEALREAALIGDFREYDPKRPGSELGLKLACWLNAIERNEFYAPFGEKDEAVACIPKYEFCLPRFAEVLQHPERFAAEWGSEYEQVRQHEEVMRSAKSRLHYLPEIQLLIIDTPEPLHYYALFGQSREADMVLSCYDDHRYELEYKYTSWVDTAHRKHYPRLPLEPLAEQLEAQEFSDESWFADRMMDTGPILRLGGEELSKAERYDHPFRRPIYSSSIAPEIVKAVVMSFFRLRLTDVPMRKHWTWAEMREYSNR